MTDDERISEADRRRVRRAECGRVVVELDAEREGWRYWSDGTGALVPFCAECSRREFGT